MRRCLVLTVVVLGLLLAASGTASAQSGSLTVTASTPQPGLTKYTLAWTSSAGGAVSTHRFAIIRGNVIEAKFVPGSGGTQPTNGYSVTLVDQDSLDILAGAAASLSNTAASAVLFSPPWVHDGVQTFDLVVSGAGNAKTGTVYLWVR